MNTRTEIIGGEAAVGVGVDLTATGTGGENEIFVVEAAVAAAVQVLSIARIVVVVEADIVRSDVVEAVLMIVPHLLGVVPVHGAHLHAERLLRVKVPMDAKSLLQKVCHRVVDAWVLVVHLHVILMLMNDGVAFQVKVESMV